MASFHSKSATCQHTLTFVTPVSLIISNRCDTFITHCANIIIDNYMLQVFYITFSFDAFMGNCISWNEHLDFVRFDAT